ncbi:hypothetical protein [Nonomuraea phyllanthi]|uniref:hypothetical protein n=1 Tax=Nonomuraea phyllanthi TaxID=2219224 RepID=UPI001D016178|nr:hypothetical protein [Nonomuraea phyllanthi]
MHTLVKGLIAGAAGTSALNIATYLDMAIRARAASSTPQQAVEKLTDLTDVDLGDDEQADHRKQALAALGTTDPRQWSARRGSRTPSRTWRTGSPRTRRSRC